MAVSVLQNLFMIRCCFISGAMSAQHVPLPRPSIAPGSQLQYSSMPLWVNSNVQHDLWESAHACIERVLHSSLWLSTQMIMQTCCQSDPSNDSASTNH
jgi:hypothetical protein